MNGLKLSSVSYNRVHLSSVEIKNEHDTRRTLSRSEMMKLYMEIRRLREQVSRAEALQVRR